MFSFVYINNWYIIIDIIIIFVEIEELLNEECLKFNLIYDELEKFVKKLNGLRFKLRIDEDDILNDVIVYYKSLSFDFIRLLRI